MKKLLSVIVLTISVILCISSVTVQADGIGEIVYEEGFEYGETDILPTTDKTGTAKIMSENGNHYLHFEGNKTDDYSLACFGPYVADFDFSVKVRQKIHNGSWSNCMILFHIDWNVNAYRLDLFEDHARIAFNNGVDEEKSFGSYDGFGVLDDKWYNIQIYGRGNEYTVVMDGKVITTFISDERDEGNFGFCGWQTEFDVDDIKITEYVDGTAPAVNTLVFGIEDEESNREIIENERKTRKMTDNVIDVINNISGSSALIRVILYISLVLAIISAVTVIAIIILWFIKKNKSNKI